MKNYKFVGKTLNIAIIIGFFILLFLYYIGDISVKIELNAKENNNEFLDINKTIIDYMNRNNLICEGSKLYFDYGDVFIKIYDFKK